MMHNYINSCLFVSTYFARFIKLLTKLYTLLLLLKLLPPLNATYLIALKTSLSAFI
jgi:hypothetical protein